jgi:LmbE family N-acetylglucosaminyl deacetylase
VFVLLFRDYTFILLLIFKSMKRIFSAVLFLLSGLSLSAQQYRPMSSSEIYEHIEKLNVLGTVMYLAAHPDDENTRLISYLVHHDHVRTIYLSLTRGDGGQNILGDEQGAALGLIRTHELLEARKIDGAEQLFTPVIDFGFTKSPEETFTFWDKQSLVGNVVAAIQRYKPDMIVCRFPTTGEGGHGQHTASAIVAGEAYTYIQKYNDTAVKKLWLPKRLLFNSFRFGSANTIRPGQFEMDINQYDPLLGAGYGEMAGRSRSAHKSQGAGTPQSVGVTAEHFQLIAGAPMTHSFYDDIDLSWGRVGAAEIGKDLQQVLSHFSFTDPSASIPALIKIREKIGTLDDDFWKQEKLQEIDAVILSSAGVMAEALTEEPEAVAGSRVAVKLRLIARGSIPVKAENAGASGKILKGGVPATTLIADSVYQFDYEIKLNDSESLTEPYWMKAMPRNNTYQYDSAYGGIPEAVNELNMVVRLHIGGADFRLPVPLSYKKTDPVKGDVIQRLRIVPKVSIEPNNNLFIYQKGAAGTVTLHLKVFEDIATSSLAVYANQTQIETVALPELKRGLDTFISIDVPTDKLSGKPEQDILAFAVEAGGHNYSREIHLIDYPHIPELQYFTDARMKAIPKDWKVAVKKIGYIEGVGDYVDEVLRLCGLTVEEIPLNRLNDPLFLKQYDAIVMGIRALNTQKELISGMGGLMEYTKAGGTLLIQYNTNRGLVTTHIGPYPLTLSRDRVTEEDAKVTFTDPASSLLHFPNTITGKDFDDWIQERGIYFPGEWDKHYQTMLSMHDVGGQGLRSAILYAPYGKGQYIYTSLVFFRELPAGNVGAIKLFMNLLSAGKQD